MSTAAVTPNMNVPLDDTRRQAIPRWQRAALVVGTIELAVLYAPTLVWLWERWTLSVWHHAHGLLIPPVVGLLRGAGAAPAPRGAGAGQRVGLRDSRSRRSPCRRSTPACTRSFWPRPRFRSC